MNGVYTCARYIASYIACIGPVIGVLLVSPILGGLLEDFATYYHASSEVRA